MWCVWTEELKRNKSCNIRNIFRQHWLSLWTMTNDLQRRKQKLPLSLTAKYDVPPHNKNPSWPHTHTNRQILKHIKYLHIYKWTWIAEKKHMFEKCRSCMRVWVCWEVHLNKVNGRTEEELQRPPGRLQWRKQSCFHCMVRLSSPFSVLSLRMVSFGS